MYIFSVTVSKSKIVVIIAMLLIFILASIYLYHYFRGAKAIAYPIVNTAEGRLKFINQLGWEVDPLFSESETNVVPEKFDKLYNEYEKLQKSQGLSLSPYKGKTLLKYTYKILNYKEPERAVYINIFVDNELVVAGDINDPDLQNGFVKTFLNEG